MKALITFLLSLTIVLITNPEPTSQTITCKSRQYANSDKPQCEIHLHLSEDANGVSGTADCYQSNAGNVDNVVVQVNQLIANVSFVCTSKRPLDVKIHFENQTPIFPYTNVVRKRIVEDFDKPREYRHEISIEIPTRPRILGPKELTTLVKYEFFNGGTKNELYSSADLNVLFYILQFNWNNTRNTKYHWMQESTTVEANAEIILIPCLSLAGNISIFRFRNDTANQNIELTSLAEDALEYDPGNGFRYNTSKVEDFPGSYICTAQNFLHEILSMQIIIPVEEWEDCCLNKTFNFDIELQPDVKVEPIEKFLLAEDMFTTDLMYNLQMKRESFQLFCSSIHGKVEIIIDRNITWSGDLSINMSTFETQKPQKRFNSVATISHVGQEACTKVKSNGQCAHDVVFIRCSNETHTLQSWTLRTKLHYTDEEYGYPIHSLYFDANTGTFVCDTYNDNSMEHLICNSVLQCHMFTECLQSNQNESHRRPRDNCIISVTKLAKSSCEYYKIIPSEDEDRIANGTLRRKTCNVANTGLSTKGILQCSSLARDYLEAGLEMEYYRVKYFVGFNGIMYGDARATPQEATLKLTPFYQDDLYYTLGHFTFMCEAQSFFYEGGIRWLQEHGNGTVTQVPRENIREVLDFDENAAVTVNNDNDNPESVVEILFLDATIEKIICAAPKLYTSEEWSFVQLEVTVRNSIAPIVSSEDTQKSFREGDTDQSLSCYAEGFPRPEIKWTRDDKELQDGLQVVDMVIYKVLIFPNYNESLAGEYKCTASNIAGEISQAFQVNTLVDKEAISRALSYTLPSVAFGILLCATLLTCFIYQRRARNEKYTEIEEIIKILHGVLDSDTPEGEPRHPLSVFYEESYEIVKTRFVVDKSEPCIVGKGEFGIVFKWQLDGVDGYAAFKTLHDNARTLHLKMLVSELKIMMYIGEHENIVQLIGACTKDIRHGNFFVVTEYCGLGSLETYLRSNKHLFLKQINAVNSSHPNTFSIHTFQRLLVWSGQIANAMDYLVSKKVIHSDLATRNVLLTADAIAKVTDFGLSRRTYNYTEYIKKGEEPLPWQWLALETLKTNKFSPESDAWAYGITLWEIFSFGDVPYPGYSLTMDFVQQLELGFRNAKPKLAHDELYEIMSACWDANSESRSKFNVLRAQFENMVPNWRHYVSKAEKPKVVAKSVGVGYVAFDCMGDTDEC